MKTYLSVVNPVVAALVLALCLWAATHDDGKFKPEGILAGSIRNASVSTSRCNFKASQALGRFSMNSCRSFIIEAIQEQREPTRDGKRVIFDEPCRDRWWWCWVWCLLFGAMPSSGSNLGSESQSSGGCRV